MKKLLILIIVFSGILAACKKSWLEVVPFGSLTISSTDDYDKVMNDPDFYFQARFGGWGEAQLMGDEIAAEGAYFVTLGDRDLRSRLFEWRDSVYTASDQSSFALYKHLIQSYQWNKVIDEVMSSSGGTDDRKRAIRAEALATRAWSTFNMAQNFCKPYNAATASSDMGFPLITKADVNIKEYPRGTVQQTYDFITNDLKEAIASLPASPAFPTRWSKPAAQGLLGKVYLFMGRYNDALPLLKSALAGVLANGRPTLYNYNETLAPGGAFMPININSGPVNNPGNLQNDMREAVISKVFYSGRFNGNYTGINGTVLTPQARALYGPTDLRLKLYTTNNPDNTPNAASHVRKYGVQYSRWGLQLPDLYLLSAEVKARTGDLPGAVADVETLRRNRMPAADAVVPPAIAGNQTALVKFIIDERIREFAMEGYRWFDMRRLTVDPLFAGITFTHTRYNANGTTTVYTLHQPNRLTLKFPRNILDGSPDTPDNP
jgi:hypothetical protein